VLLFLSKFWSHVEDEGAPSGGDIETRIATQEPSLDTILKYQ
jgi:hypothetical protein